MTPRSPRKTLYIPPDLWEMAERATAEAGAKRGKPMSVSEWVREAIREKAEREETE